MHLPRGRWMASLTIRRRALGTYTSHSGRSCQNSTWQCKQFGKLSLWNWRGDSSWNPGTGIFCEVDWPWTCPVYAVAAILLPTRKAPRRWLLIPCIFMIYNNLIQHVSRGEEDVWERFTVAWPLIYCPYLWGLYSTTYAGRRESNTINSKKCLNV